MQACFAFDSSGDASSSSAIGDAICALAALAYSTYDIYLAGVGDKVPSTPLNLVRALVGTVCFVPTARAPYPCLPRPWFLVSISEPHIFRTFDNRRWAPR